MTVLLRSMQSHAVPCRDCYITDDERIDIVDVVPSDVGFIITHTVLRRPSASDCVRTTTQLLTD